MTKINLASAAWACREQGCDEHGTGTQAAVDKAAERHAKNADHTTATHLARGKP